MKKIISIIITLIIIAVVIIVALNGKSEMTIIENRDDISSIMVNGVSYKESPMVDDIIDILETYESQKTRNPFPMQTSSTQLEISYVDNNKPRHIVLGDINIIYESSDESVYEVIDGDNLREEIEKVLSN